MTDLRKAAENLVVTLKGYTLPTSAEKAMHVLTQALAQPEHEPVAWANSSDLENFDMRVRTNRDHYHTVPLYTAPPKREWVGLTDEEKEELVDAFYGTDIQRLEAIEVKLKEKNA